VHAKHNNAFPRARPSSSGMHCIVLKEVQRTAKDKLAGGSITAYCDDQERRSEQHQYHCYLIARSVWKITELVYFEAAAVRADEPFRLHELELRYGCTLRGGCSSPTNVMVVALHTSARRGTRQSFFFLLSFKSCALSPPHMQQLHTHTRKKKWPTVIFRPHNNVALVTARAAKEAAAEQCSRTGVVVVFGNCLAVD
jgi:hypothetical protein